MSVDTAFRLGFGDCASVPLAQLRSLRPFFYCSSRGALFKNLSPFDISDRCKYAAADGASSGVIEDASTQPDLHESMDLRDGVGEERRGANLRDRFRQRLAGFVPMEWLLNTHRDFGRLQTQRSDASDLEAGAVRENVRDA